MAEYRGRRLGPHLRQAEIEDLGLAACGQEDIGRLDVAMDDAGAVRGVEGVGQRCANVEQRRQLDRARTEPLAQRLSLEQLHREIVSIALLADVVDGADVRVIERRGGARLAQKALDSGGVSADGLRQQLESNPAPQPRVFGPVHDPHAARAKR